MGTDIYAHVEGEVSPGKWEYLGELNLGRSYDIFAMLAGVRGDGPEPKGLPEDLSDRLREEWEIGWPDSYLPANNWAHSPSWGNCAELFALGCELGWEEWYHGLRSHEGLNLFCYRDFRVVYWFD